MGKKNQFFTTILPVMLGFFVMGFVDLVGISTNYVKADLGMSDSVSSLISVSCFVWFFLLSIPTGFLMNKYGRKNVVLVSFILSMVALVIPIVLKDSFAGYLVAFALLGIGNTLLQVAMNPLVSEVVSGDRLTGTITLGQFVKAVCSFLAPIIAAACVRALKAHGFRVPEDVSVIGFDDMPLCSLLEPPLTTVGVEKELIGRLAMQLLYRRMLSAPAHSLPSFLRITSSAKLILRESVR